MRDETGIAYTPIGVEGPQPAKLRLDGRDNYGNLRQKFADTLAQLDDKEFVKAAERHIWLSAYAANNYRSDYHWQADACHDESIRRGKQYLYEKAWHQASGM